MNFNGYKHKDRFLEEIFGVFGYVLVFSVDENFETPIKYAIQKTR